MMRDHDIADEKAAHVAHRDAMVAIFRAEPHQTISYERLLAITPNFMQRVSEARQVLKAEGVLENVPRYAMIDGRRKRITGDYRFRPAALGREADTHVRHADAHLGPLFDTPGAYQR